MTTEKILPVRIRPNPQGGATFEFTAASERERTALAEVIKWIMGNSDNPLMGILLSQSPDRVEILLY